MRKNNPEMWDRVGNQKLHGLATCPISSHHTNITEETFLSFQGYPTQSCPEVCLVWLLSCVSVHLCLMPSTPKSLLVITTALVISDISVLFCLECSSFSRCPLHSFEGPVIHTHGDMKDTHHFISEVRWWC